MKILSITLDSSRFEVEVEPTDSIGELKEEIIKKLPEPKPSAASQKLLVRVFEGGKITLGVEFSAKTEELLKPIVHDVKAAESPKETEYEDQTPGTPNFPTMGWESNEPTISAKVMNSSYNLSLHELTKDTEEGCVDILVIVPLVVPPAPSLLQGFWQFSGVITNAKKLLTFASESFSLP
ncbi:hypothetical protein HK098_001795 [Nowakowskiella sp. JEL0407]|nr:hypothetical protein HK098_001795 [Nowakowskiella sp. JEL0407]